MVFLAHSVKLIKGYVYYIFASLCFKSTQEHLPN